MIEMTRAQVVDGLMIARGLKPRIMNEKDMMKYKMSKRREIADKEYELSLKNSDIV